MKGKRDRKTDKNIKCSLNLWCFLGLAAGHMFSDITSPKPKGANYRSYPWPLLKLGDGHLSGLSSFDIFSRTLKFYFSLPHHSLTCSMFQISFSKPGMWICACTSALLNIWKSSPWFKWKKKNTPQSYFSVNSTNTPEEAESFIDMFDKETAYCVVLMH